MANTSVVACRGSTLKPKVVDVNCGDPVIGIRSVICEFYESKVLALLWNTRTMEGR